MVTSLRKAVWLLRTGQLLPLALAVFVAAFAPQTLSQQTATPSGDDLPDGSMIYMRQGCTACHGRDGGGGIGPGLADNQNLRFVEPTIAQIVFGNGRMPAFGDRLSNEQIAAVVSFIRTCFGNDFGAVSVQQVADVRDIGREALELPENGSDPQTESDGGATKADGGATLARSGTFCP